MACKLLDAGGVLRTITKCRVLDGGTLRNILRMKVMDADGTTLRTVATFAAPLSLSAPLAYSEGFTEQQSTSTTATPTGGLGPYSYSWAYLSGTVLTVSGSTTATPTFTSPTMTPGQAISSTYRCTCTDSSGQTATADAEINFQYLEPF